MKITLKQQISSAIRNERGLTLVEVLAVLVLTVLITGLLSYVLSFANTSLQQVSARESVLQESRDIIQHITSSVRQSGFLPDGWTPATPSGPRSDPEAGTSEKLILKKNVTGGTHEDTIIEYSFYKPAGSQTGSLTVERRRSDGTSSLHHTFSENVESVAFRAEQQHLKGPVRYTVTLAIRLPNDQTRKTMTTILSSDR